ncbi:ATP-binding cassette domain-containing protein [Spongiibacter marinus]|jgi:ATP-binding cassette subfamily F protein uup|uniref:ATP-binding cassette domain-containing protein n=1 Tax=Spongiibacter marinus TaxID=354246 RepID=UPI00195FA74B|nr:ATP-binding cassette domain-containing protein [Spongiibacter marinus]MBM7422755.1 ATP-binding cassette subfamily F protein uup [Spongiibacter marinus]MEE2651462.1 ATP-binding cassette domain-containing protein [Pseudomonadota bacterium]
MPLIRGTQLQHSIGQQTVLDNTDIQLDDGDRVCLLGRNGCGKSTLLRMVEGGLQPDAGEFWRQPGLVIARMEQNLDFASADDCVFDVVAGGLSELGDLLKGYHSLTHGEMNDASLKALERLQRQIEAADGWRFQQRIESTLSRLELDPEAPISSLSGGWLRRVSLARALVAEPDVLLLDEPTNHLDVEGILWLEQCVKSFGGCVLFVTHDRALIESLANRIIELDRGQLKNYDGTYSQYLQRREHELEVEAEHNALFDKRLAQEEVWIRQGIKARRTRNEGRVRALEQMRRERAQRREQQGTARLNVNEGTKTGKIVAELTDVCFSVPGRDLVKNFNLLLNRGDKLALIGPNGAGKTTLLRLILGELAPQSGEVKQGSNLQVAYFDQLRDRLDPNERVVDIVGQGRESVSINGSERHIMSYLGDFLFTPERARSHFGVLSGGERARVQLACLFTQPANVLVMDEPTNDLDMETLELLESLLVDFKGTVLLVSHDRSFVDSVASSCLLFEGNGNISEHIGGYSEVAAYQARRAVVAPEKPKGEKKATAAPAKKAARKKLSYKDQRELDNLPDKIDDLESQLQQLSDQSASAEFYQQDAQKVNDTLARLAALQEELDSCMERWMELSEAAGD